MLVDTRRADLNQTIRLARMAKPSLHLHSAFMVPVASFHEPCLAESSSNHGVRVHGSELSRLAHPAQTGHVFIPESVSEVPHVTSQLIELPERVTCTFTSKTSKEEVRMGLCHPPGSVPNAGRERNYGFFHPSFGRES